MNARLEGWPKHEVDQGQPHGCEQKTSEAQTHGKKKFGSDTAHRNLCVQMFSALRAKKKAVTRDDGLLGPDVR